MCHLSQDPEEPTGDEVLRLSSAALGAAPISILIIQSNYIHLLLVLGLIFANKLSNHLR